MQISESNINQIRCCEKLTVILIKGEGYTLHPLIVILIHKRNISTKLRVQALAMIKSVQMMQRVTVISPSIYQVSQYHEKYTIKIGFISSSIYDPELGKVQYP